ncbi:uncharacterized protein LOC128547129 [Mercenaria mercenaria]|uniref:uncharacterized protein LOC128547129 n=1 Tax=Mercenaria mercenaria TaxID=6596 RepID=UPI00234E98A1|nr:uncharacterized protein LOC128547129 [Mercenaria mercenaria]
MERHVYFVLLLVVTVHQVRGDHHHHHHHHDCHDHDCDLVNAAIENIGMYFDRHLCHTFKHVQCANHILPSDEQVCASDGHTYDNHCRFAKARCRVVIHGTYVNHMLTNPLTIARYGPCVTSSFSSKTSTTQSTSGSPTMTAISSGSGSISKQTLVPTQPSATTSTLSAFTTSSTAMSVQSILGSVFCQYKGSVDCGQNLSVVCGSDGKFYPNMCELLKEQCVDPMLREDTDVTHCSLSP